MNAKSSDANDPRAPDAPVREILRPHAMTRSKPTRFDLAPDQAGQDALARFLQVLSVENARFKGEIRPVGKEDWIVEGRLTARVAQACVISLAPVMQDIDEAVRRRFIPADEIGEDDEIDLDLDAEDDTDGYTDRIDLGLLMTEAIALALDPYPRAADAELGDAEFSPPGAEPISDEIVKPFAKLAALKEKLSDGNS